MIAKAHTGSSFGGLSRYLQSGRSQSEEGRIAWVESRHLVGAGPYEAAKEMQATAAQNPRVEKPVYHVSISFPREEQVDRSTMVHVAENLLRDLGLDEHQALLVAHKDTQHRHLHLMINRVHPESLRAWHTGHDYQRIEQSLRRSERSLGLRRVPGNHSPTLGRPRPDREPGDTPGEAQMRIHTQREPWSARTRIRLAGEFEDASSWADLESRLQRRGFRLRPRGRGLVVVRSHRQMKASRIRRSASAHRLAERFGMTYSEYRRARASLIRDARALRRAVAEEKTHLRSETGWAQAKRREGVVLSELRAARSERAACARSVRTHFEATYREPTQALRSLVARARSAGWSEAGRVVREAPECLGSLRASRATVQVSVGNAAQAIEQYGRLLRRRTYLVGEAAVARQALSGLGAARTPFGRTASVRSRRSDLEIRLAKSAVRLGVESLRFVLSPSPLRLAKLALRSAKLTHSLVAERGR